MAAELPRLFLTRHGDTAWTESGQRTGRTDLPLNERGEVRARQIGEQLRRFSFNHVFTSPLQRARKTCELANFAAVAEVVPELTEWDYGQFEGKRTREIVQQRPSWDMFRDGCPGGESPEDVAARVDRFIARVRATSGDVLAFSSAHVIRVIVARWLGLPPVAGRFFLCRPASVGVLTFEHNNLDEPAIGLWNYVRQAEGEATARTGGTATEQEQKRLPR
jgi:probable phosphoglycerate mutase